MSNRSQSRLGFLFFAIGLLGGVWLLAGVVWANIEASVFDAGKFGDHLTTLQCPLIATSAEQPQVKLVLKNPLNRPIKRLVRVHIANRSILLLDEDKQWVALQPGQRRSLAWTLDPDQGVYDGRILMVGVYVGRSYPLPALQGNCGIWVLRRIPWLRGKYILFLVNLLAFGGMFGGLWLLKRVNDTHSLDAIVGVMSVLLGLYAVGMGSLLLKRLWFIAAVVLLLITLVTVLFLVQLLGGGDTLNPQAS